MEFIDRGHFSLQNNPQIEIHGAFTDEGTSQTALSYHYDLSAKVDVMDRLEDQSVKMIQYENDRQQEVHMGASEELYRKLWLKIPLKMKINTSPASQPSVDEQPSAAAQFLNTSTRPNESEPQVDSSSLRVIDSRQCSNGDCEEFIDAMMAKNGWDDPIGEHIKGLIPKGDIYKKLNVGISLPDVHVGGVDKSTKLNPILVFFLGIPYFGIRKARSPLSMDRVAAEPESLGLSGGQAAAKPESLSLSEYSSRGAIQSTYHDENEVWVHRAWFMVFSNDMIAMFRSKEDNHSNLPNPLYACQERVCMFLVLINIISNILELSQKRLLIFLEEVHQKDSEVDAYILKIALGGRNKEKENALAKDIWELERDVKNSKRVVQSQIDILRDIQKFYGDISSLIVPTREQISLALKRIEEVVKGLVEFSQRISYLLKTLRKSKRNLLNTLVGDAINATRDAAKSTTDATKEAAANTIKAIDGQRQVMSMLTILTTVFLPLGFFTSWYGMASDTHKKEKPQIFYWPSSSGWISISFTAVVFIITLCVVLKSRDPNWWRFPKPKEAPAPRGDAPASRGDAPASRGDAPASRGDAPASRGDAPASRGDAPASRGDAPASRGDVQTSMDPGSLV